MGNDSWEEGGEASALSPKGSNGSPVLCQQIQVERIIRLVR
jgi:hypothetical protein